MTTRKYEFTNEWSPLLTEFYGKTLKRIRRLSDGKIGGWIEKESNLSHIGDCWVDNEAHVFDKARISGNARISGEAKVCGNARVGGKARILGNARVCGWAQVDDEARVHGNVDVDNDAHIFGKARIFGNARVGGKAQIGGEARVFGEARLYSSLLYQFKFKKVTYYVMEGNDVDCNDYGMPSNICKLIDLWRDTVPGINLEKFLKEVL